VVAVNCLGDVRDLDTGQLLAGTLTRDKRHLAGLRAADGLAARPAEVFSSNTTIAVVATNARLNKARALRVAIMAQDGLARAIDPVHTMFDGDTVFCPVHRHPRCRRQRRGPGCPGPGPGRGQRSAERGRIHGCRMKERA
jgi:L-aminopeptidase/D-esterase-like protein